MRKHLDDRNRLALVLLNTGAACMVSLIIIIIRLLGLADDANAHNPHGDCTHTNVPYRSEIVEGTNQPDFCNGGKDFGTRMRGYASADLFRGYGGNDAIWGHGGKDRLNGGTGHDDVYGGEGEDRICDGTGRDRIYLDDDTRRDIWYRVKDGSRDFVVKDRRDVIITVNKCPSSLWS